MSPKTEISEYDRIEADMVTRARQVAVETNANNYSLASLGVFGTGIQPLLSIASFVRLDVLLAMLA